MTARKTTLDMFIPEDRRQALARGDGLPTRSQGAVMFADVSGFTRLAVEFAREFGAQRGSEALAQLLDPIYAELVNTIHDFRGSVIVISGDGMTCWFDQDDGARATACAFAMRTIMTRHETISVPGGQIVSLGIKVAVAVGVARRFLVGDPAIQLLEALAGRIVDEAVSIHEVLERGDVAIQRDLLARFDGRVAFVAERQTGDGGKFAVVQEVAPLAEAQPWELIAPLDDALARKWVYRAVYVRIEQELEFLTELRRAVPVFMKFTGIDYDHDAQAGDKLDRFVRTVQAVLEHYEGYLCQLTIGGKTTNAYISFGAPLAHEDNVDRALSAALALQEETARLGFIQPVQIGITQGQLWAGAHGGGNARTYSIIGSEVNIAHRLMSHAEPGQIIVSPHVAENAPGYLLEALPPLALKGLEKPMAPYRVLGKQKWQTGAMERGFLIGREIERGILLAKLGDLVQANGQTKAAEIVMVEGEAGIGKSQLLYDFMAEAAQMGVRVWYGEGDPVESRTQYYAFRQVLEAVFQLSGLENPQAVKDTILQSLNGDPFLLERAPLLGEILPIVWQDSELTRQMVGESRAESIRETVLGVLQQMQAAQMPPVPTVLVLDDAHWVDYASWNLLRSITQTLTNILFVIFMRPLEDALTGSQVDEVYTLLRASPTTQSIELASLSLEEASGLVRRNFGVEALPLAVVEFIWMRSHGNPFFTEQIAYALRDAGIMRIAGNEAMLEVAEEDLNRIDFPATVQGIITSRIDRLSPAQQLTLKVASVIGRAFLLRMLNDVYPARTNLETLREQLTDLTRLGITDLDLAALDQNYFFRHVITQEVVYGLLTFAQRKQLHCEIAKWYEENHHADRSAYYSRLAHHWLNGEETEKAIYFLDKAGEQALELYANENAVRFITTAIELDERSYGRVLEMKADPRRVIRRARWERLLGTANQNLGRLSEALKHQGEALRLLGYPMPRRGLVTVMSLLKEISQQAFYRLRRQPPQAPRSELAHEIDLELAQNGLLHVLFFSSNVGLLAWSILFPLNVAERINLTSARAMGYTWLLLMSTFAQVRRLIGLYRRLAWEMVEQADRLNLKIHIRLIDGMASFVSCDWDRADNYFSSGMQIADQIGNLHAYANLAGARTGPLFLQGKYNESLELWLSISGKLVRREILQSLAWAQLGPGVNLLMLGKLEEALAKIEQGLVLLSKNAEDKILTTFVYSSLSLAHLRRGDHERAFKAILDHDQKAPPPSASSIFFYYAFVIDATLSLQEAVQTGKVTLPSDATAQLQRLTDRIPRFLSTMKNLPANKAGVWLYKGIYNRLTDNWKSALTDWQKALDYARRFNQPYELGRACLELGQHPGISHSARHAYLTEAYTTFAKLKTPYEQSLAETILGQFTSAATD